MGLSPLSISKQVGDSVFNISDDVEHNRRRNKIMKHLGHYVTPEKIISLTNDWMDEFLIISEELSVYDIVDKIVLKAFETFLCPGLICQ